MEVMSAVRPEDEQRRDDREPGPEEGVIVEEGELQHSMNDNHHDPKSSDSALRGYNADASAPKKPPASRMDAFANGGGMYMPPAKRRQMLEEAQKQEAAQGAAGSGASKKESLAIQRHTWQEQKRAIHGTVNRLNATTIKPLIGELFEKVNLVRLRGVLARSILQAAVTSSSYANVYAALVAVINSKLPEVGELVVKRAILAFRRHYKRRDKSQCLAMAIFLGHLFHQSVVHELLILQILTVLLDGDPTDDSVEVAVQFLTVVGQALLDVSPAGVRAVLERLRALLHEGQLNSRVEYKMEKLLAMRKKGFSDHPPLLDDLDLVESDDQITFEMSLDDEDITKEETLDVFHVDEKYEENEREWQKVRAEILGLGDGGSDDGSGDSETGDDSSSDDESEDEAAENGDAPDQGGALVPAASQAVTVQDLSEADLIHLRRTIYLTIMSSATFEECAHKLTKISIPPGREEELINMIIECCSQERTFLRYYGLIAARFCLLDDRWTDAFLTAFIEQYSSIHRLETNKLRNVAKLFAHLLHTDSMPWSCLNIVHLNEDETSSSSRIFVKILVQEMAEAMGIAKLKDRFETEDPEHSEWYKGMFPKENIRNTRYAINFFTSIGLGPLTDGLREYLKNAPKMILAQAQASALVKKSDNDDDESSLSSSSSSSSSSLSTSDYTSSSSYSSSSSEDSRRRRRPRSGRSSRRGGRRRSRSSSSSSSRTSSSSSVSSSAGSRSSYSSYSSRSVSSGSRSKSRPRSRPQSQDRKERSPSYSSGSRRRGKNGNSHSRPRKDKVRRDRSESSGSYSRDERKKERRTSSSRKMDKKEFDQPPVDDGRKRVRRESRSPSADDSQKGSYNKRKRSKRRRSRSSSLSR